MLYIDVIIRVGGSACGFLMEARVIFKENLNNLKQLFFQYCNKYIETIILLVNRPMQFIKNAN